MNERYETFTLLISRISRSIRRLHNQEMADYGLRSAHIACLHALCLQNGLTATELCERCEEDKATVSRALDFLEENGYLLYKTKSDKHYRSVITLTEKGHAVGQKISEKIERVLDEVSTGLTEEERIAFYHSLSIICEHLDHAAKRREEK